MNKKAGVGKLVGWVVFILAVILLVLMYQNDMKFDVVVQKILGWFGK